MKEIKYIDIKEFREKGYLQELNRLFLHPLGLALEVVINDDGTEKLGGIWDYREDDDGIIYHESSLEDDKFIQKARFIENEFNKRRENREKHLGFFVQPLNSGDDN